MIPLGGLGEFGMNCLALRWQDDIIVVDAGLMFPEEELLGVDIVVPDISYLTENRSKVKAILLTHGHEDHIGGLPWILSELNVPVYGTEFTLALVEGKLDEHRLLDDADLIEMLPGKRFTLGPFSIMPIRVTHSLVDCVALAIHTPVGVVLHTGDFKIDLSPPDGKAFDLTAFADLGKSGGVLALLQDSTNVDRRGWTPSERAVRPRLDEIFAQTKKKLFFPASPRLSLASASPSSWPRSMAARSPSSAAPWITLPRSPRTWATSRFLRVCSSIPARSATFPRKSFSS